MRGTAQHVIVQPSFAQFAPHSAKHAIISSRGGTLSHQNMLLENSSIDVARGNALDSSPVLGWILNGEIDVDHLKAALEQTVQNYPVLKARMDKSGKQLVLPDEDSEPFSWTVVEQNKPLSAVFTEPPTSDTIVVTPVDTGARADFYVPLATTVVRRPNVAKGKSPLIEIRVQKFTDKTVIGLSWNHLLTDGGGIAKVLSAWAKASKGEPLPEPASCNDPFKAHYFSSPYPPKGSVVPGFYKKFGAYSRAIAEIIRYGKPDARSIFIPNSILAEWKSKSDGVSTNDLITAWLFKGWASTVNSLTVSIITVMDLRKHLPDIVPANYLRNAGSARASPQTLSSTEINNMSQLELAKLIRSFVQYFTPEVEMNHQSYEYIHCREGFGMWPVANTALTLSSWSMFRLPQMDFGAKVESFEGFQRLSRQWGNVGSVWLEDGGARISFWMSKKRWSRGIWKDLPTKGIPQHPSEKH